MTFAEDERVLPFEQSTRFYLKCAEEAEKENDPVTAARYLRAGWEAGSAEAGRRLAFRLSAMQCVSASDSVLYRLKIADEFTDDCCYAAGCNALMLGRYSLARAALNRYLNISPDGMWAENAEQMLEHYDPDFFGDGTGNSRRTAAKEAAREYLLCGCPDKAERYIRRERDPALRALLAGAGAYLNGDSEEALRLLPEKCANIRENTLRALIAACCLGSTGRPSEGLAMLLGTVPALRELADLRLFVQASVLCRLPVYGRELCRRWLKDLPFSAEVHAALFYACRAMRDERGAEEAGRMLCRLQCGLPDENILPFFSEEQRCLRDLVLSDYHKDLAVDSGEDDRPDKEF